MSLSSKIESILLVATRPMSTKRLAELIGAKPDEVTAAVDTLAQKYNVDDSGLQVLRHASSIQLVTSPMNSKLVTDYLKEEQAGELTRPSLETLTIIAYRGPISKIQLDTIRGVNCALILRNLMIKGLVEAMSHKDKMQTSYQVTTDFIKFLGLTAITELPDYEQLNRDEQLEQLLNPQAVAVSQEHPNTQPPSHADQTS